MKLEYLDDITDGGKYPDADPDKLIRLFSFDQEEAEKLANVIQYWLVNKKESLEVSNLPFVKSVNCSLTLQISPEDLGIVPSNDNNFISQLTLDRYLKMISYIRAFCDNEELNGYNWLYDPGDGQIDLLFSPSGTW